MKNYAIIEKNIVANIAVSESPMYENWVEVHTDLNVGIGWSYDGVNFAPPTHLVSYTISGESVSANDQPISKYAGNYYVNSGDTIKLEGSLTDTNGSTPNISVPITLKLPLVRHANGKPTQDEIYLNVMLNEGVLTATGLIDRSGDWKILFDRVNEAIQRIGAEWKLEHPDVTFLA